ncbi:MAG: hypothetical protein K2K45_06990 [Muribaculaceae bacterium]|nr:hypothetical protein [Muribaculaceae bacterium]
MERKAKFTFGDKVYVIKDSKVKELEVKSIVLGKDEIRYSGDESGLFFIESYHEDQCFASREELCNYILGKE